MSKREVGPDAFLKELAALVAAVECATANSGTRAGTQADARARKHARELYLMAGHGIDPYAREQFAALTDRKLPPKPDPFAGERLRLVNRESGSGDQTPPRLNPIQQPAQPAEK